MSIDVQNVVDAAIATALADASVTAAAPGGVWNGKATGSTAAGAWLEYSGTASPDELRTLRSAAGATGRIVRLRYILRAIAQGPSKVAAKAALTAADGVLDDATLTLSAGTFLSCRRERFLGDLVDDLVGGVTYQVIPAHYLVQVQI